MGRSLRQVEQAALGHRHWVRSIAWSPDGRRLASGSTDMTVRVWDAESGREILPLPGHLEEVNSVAWNPNGESIASASGDGKIKIWDATAGKVLRTLRGHNAQVKAVAWSPDGTRLASASWDETVKIWDVRTGKQTLTLGGNECPINTVAWSPDGLAIVSGAEDQSVVIYDASVGHRSGLAPRVFACRDPQTRRRSQECRGLAPCRRDRSRDGQLEGRRRGFRSIPGTRPTRPVGHLGRLGCGTLPRRLEQELSTRAGCRSACSRRGHWR